MSKTLKIFIKTAGISLLILIGCVSLGKPAAAVSANEFQAGRIIDDSVFYNTGSFASAQAVQDFITSHTPTCDTWGTKPSGYGNLTRAQYAQQVMGWPGPPYACLQNYHENPATGQTSYEMGGGWFSGGQSAGQIIYDASQKYGINPEVLLVLLKKESAGPLFSDSWPLKSQYKYAMGYGCPDSGPNYSANCQASKAGFYNQVNYAAWQLRYYANNITTYNYQPGRWNYIQYSPDPSCGGKSVYIENMATASLYIYTPYVPNSAALAAYPGTASCGAYGNRNFFMFFNEWFGSTYGAVNVTTPLTVTSGFSQGVFTGKTITARFTIKNNSAQRQDLGTMAIATRNEQGVNYDFGSQRVILEPWQTYTYEATTILSSENRYSFSIVNYRDGVGWSSDYPASLNSAYARSVNDLTVLNMPTVTVAPYVEETNIHIGQPTNVRMTIKNNSSAYPVNLGYFGIAMTSPLGANVDLAFDTVNSLAAGASYSYVKEFTPTQSGMYRARVSSTGDNGQTWSETTYPAAVAPAFNELSISVKSNPTLTQGLSIQGGSRVGDDITGTFSVKNFSASTVEVNKKLCYIVRSSMGKNYDLGCLAIGTLSPGQVLTYNGSRRVLDAGQYSGYFSMYDGRSWYDNWTFEKETGSEPGNINFTVKGNPTITQGLTIDTMNPRVGNTITGSFTVKNSSTQDAEVNKKICYILRGPSGQNYDLGCLNVGTLPSGQSMTFSGVSRQLTDAGNYSGYFSMYDGTWHDNWTFAKETGTEPTAINFSVKSTPTLTQGLTVNDSSPSVGSTLTGTFKVRNSSSTDVSVNKKLCYIIRGPGGSNNDLGCLTIGTMTAGQELTYTGSRAITATGQYSGYFSMYDGTWHDNWTFEKELGTETTQLTFYSH